MTKYNPNLIRVVLNHYFCNLAFQSDDECLEYFETLNQAVEQDEDVEWCDLPDYIIWEPFQDTTPSDVIANMFNLYEDMFHSLDPAEQLFIDRSKIKELYRLKLQEFILSDEQVLNNIYDLTLDIVSNTLMSFNYDQVDFSPDNSELTYTYENPDSVQITAQLNLYTLTWNFYK